jgi:hypothetical protein
MDESRSVKFLGLLRTLLRHGVDFFVVGGVAAQLEGAPILTFDLDVLYKDRAVLPVLRQTLAMKARRSPPKSPQGDI